MAKKKKWSQNDLELKPDEKKVEKTNYRAQFIEQFYKEKNGNDKK